LSRPFDEARYLGLLEGLEISVLNLSDLNDELRYESEFFRKPILKALRKIKALPHLTLGELTKKIQHPVEVERTYSDSGLRLLLAQEVRSNELSLGEGSFMPTAMELKLSANKLVDGDVVITRSGANVGQCAPVKTSAPLFACADLLVIRKGKLPGGYISTFLNTVPGRLLLDRGVYGMAQPHIAPTYIKTVPVPSFGSKLLNAVETLIGLAETSKTEAATNLDVAGRTLLSALKLGNWQPPNPLSYTHSSNNAFAAGRLDAEYFRPRVRELLTILGQGKCTIGDLAPARRERFFPANSGTFDYLEIGSVRMDGTVEAEPVPHKEAPSRATSYVRSGDVISSMVRPIRRLSALISPEQNGFVCSSGFVVLQPKHVAPEVLLTYLRLPVVCELMDLHTSASLYPAISEQDLLTLPMPNPDAKTCEAICTAVKSSQASRRQAKAFLEAAKRAVEIAIEDSETAALHYLDEILQDTSGH
jgi:type I restriction enzyme, S subunit